MGTSFVAVIALACVVRGPPDIDTQTPEWQKATPLERYDQVWNARDVPTTAAIAEPVLAQLIAQKPRTSANLWRVAAFRWWIAEGEKDAIDRAHGLLAAADLLAAVARAPELVPARYYRALVRFTQAADTGWTPAARAEFLADLDAVLKREPTWDDGGAQAALGRYWLGEGDVEKARAQVQAAYALSSAERIPKLNGRVLYVATLVAHRSTPRDPKRVQAELMRLLHLCGGPDSGRTSQWLKPDWTAITGEPEPP